jgi:hypothetical protein
VKRDSADDTAVSGRGKVGRRLFFFAFFYQFAKTAVFM